MARWRNRLLLVKMEATYGVDPVAEGADAIKVSDLEVTPLEVELLDRELITGAFGHSEKVTGSRMSMLEFPAEVAGSGTAGTPPRIGRLIRACGYSENITAAPITGAAQAGAAGSITLAAGASSVNGFYVGMTISITSGTGNGQVGVIYAYTGASRVALVAPRTTGFTAGADSQYSIGANVKYTLVDTDQESVSLQFHADGTLHLARGARGTFGYNLEHKEIPKFEFEFQGLYTPATAAANPIAAFANQANPIAVNSGNTRPVLFHDYPVTLQSIEFSQSNELVHNDRAGGTEQVEVTNWEPEGTAMIEAPELGDKDYFAAVSSQATGLAMWSHGQTAGNIVTCVHPRINLGTASYDDLDGTLGMEIEFMANPTIRNDETVYVFS